MSELRKCPFCGGNALIDENIFEESSVVCQKCYAHSEWWRNESEAIKKWNTRQCTCNCGKQVKEVV